MGVLWSTGSAFAHDNPPQAAKPLRLVQSDWFALRVKHHTRYETVRNQFRAGLTGNDGLVAIRTGVHGKLKLESVKFGLELVDSRAYLADENTPVNTAIVNVFVVQQAYVEAELHTLWGGENPLVLKAGRLTLDVGSRRSVARNKYHNTINAYTGAVLIVL